MRKKTRPEMEKAKIVKATRTLIRLRHSLAADEQLNEILPDTLAEFDEALARGELKKLKSDLVDEIGAL